MKKIFYSLFALAVSALALQSCEDVPAPYDIPGSGDKPTVIEPAGNGTETDPYNIAGIIKATENLNSGETLPEKVYFTGVVTSVKECSPSYGNATFYLGDDIESTKTFYVYQCLGLGNKNIASEDEVQVGDTITIYGSITNYNGTIETAKKDAYIYKSSRNGSSEPVGEGEPKGSGTLEDPYNSVAANKVAAALSSTEQSGVVYVKGKVVSVKEQYSTQYGNASYYISDDGTSAGQFYVFRSMYLGNKKYSSGDLLKEGDEVIVCGKLMNYMGNTPETVQNESYLYSLNGKTEGGGSSDAGTPKGSGTQADPFNVAGIIKYTSALAANEQSADKVYFKGIVSNAKDISATFKNATFYISEDGSANNEFYVFRAKGLNGADITSSDDVRKGDEVVICGNVVNYMGNTPETVQGEAYIVSIKHNSVPGGGSDGGGDVPPTGDNLLGNGGFETWNGDLPANWKTTSTAGNATLSKSTDAHGGSYSVSIGYTSSANKRMGYKETELEAGTYVFTFYAKATNGGKCQTRAGYVPVKDGSVGSYIYGDYVDIKNTEWKQVTYEFELKEKSTVCLVIMNPKSTGYHESQNILVDDAKLIKK